jgi:hypothetical protein
MTLENVVRIGRFVVAVLSFIATEVVPFIAGF